MQIRVPDLSLASAWTGPPVEPYVAAYAADPALIELVRRLSQRRMPAEQAEREIRAFADAAGGQRRDRLLAMMAGIFTTLADERGAVMAGLDRYGRRQKELAADVRADVEALRNAQAAPDANATQLVTLQQKVEWGARLLEQIRQSLSFACDVPTRIERRMFILARIVQPLVE